MASQRISGDDTQATTHRQQPHSPSPRERLSRECLGRVNEVVYLTDPYHPGLFERRGSYRFRAGQGTGM